MIVPTFCITVERIKHGPLSEAKQVIVMAFKLVKMFHGPSLDQVSMILSSVCTTKWQTILTVAPKLNEILLKGTYDIVKSMLFFENLEVWTQEKDFFGRNMLWNLEYCQGTRALDPINFNFNVLMIWQFQTVQKRWFIVLVNAGFCFVNKNELIFANAQ